MSVLQQNDLTSDSPKRAGLTVTVAAFIAAATALGVRAWLEPSHRNGKIVLLEYAFVFFASVGMNNLSKHPSIRKSAKALLGAKWLIFPVAGLIAVWSYRLGMFQFGAYDEGLVVNVANHYLHGWKPNIDYPSPLPPLFMAGIRTVVLILPFRWASIVLFSSLFGAVTALWLYGLLAILRVPLYWALVVTMAIELSTMFVLPFWWYNNSTSVAVLLLMFSVVCCLRAPERFLAWLSLAVSLGMTMSAKPNVALIGLAPFVLLFTKRPMHWVRAATAAVGAVFVALIIFRLAQLSPLGLLRAYREISGTRGNPFLLYAFRQFEVSEAAILACLVGFLLILFLDFFVKFAKTSLEVRQLRPILIVGFLSLVTVFEMVCTNGELKNVDLIVLYGALVLLVFGVPSDLVDPQGKLVLLTLTIFFAIWSGFWGVVHLRILGVGEDKFYQPLPTQRIESGFLIGLEAGPRLLRVQRQVADVLAKYPAKKVFFGPRLEFEDAVFGKELIPGMPIQWDPGTLYSDSRTPVILENFKREDPDLLIFLHRDFTRMYTVGDYIREASIYHADLSGFPDLEIYVRELGPKVRAN